MASVYLYVFALAAAFSGNSASLIGDLLPIINGTNGSTPNPLTINQCAPSPINGIIAVNPCICDCLYEHDAENGLCNSESQCICYYEGEPEADLAPVIPLIAAQCPQVVTQCYSDTNPIAKSAFVLGCNLDCICTHGAPNGGECDFDNHACICDYEGINKNTTGNSGCPEAFKEQFIIFIKGFLEQAAACALTPPRDGKWNPSCDTLLTYPVLIPAAEATRCFDGATIASFQDIIATTVLAPLLPVINV